MVLRIRPTKAALAGRRKHSRVAIAKAKNQKKTLLRRRLFNPKRWEGRKFAVNPHRDGVRFSKRINGEWWNVPEKSIYPIAAKLIQKHTKRFRRDLYKRKTQYHGSPWKYGRTIFKLA